MCVASLAVLSQAEDCLLVRPAPAHFTSLSRSYDLSHGVREEDTVSGRRTRCQEGGHGVRKEDTVGGHGIREGETVSGRRT